jgi:hypothetical protein
LGDKSLDEYFKSESERLEGEARDKGYAKFFKAPVGETRMTLKYQKPRVFEGEYGSRRVFRVSVDGKEYDFPVNEHSPLYRFLVRKLADAKGDVEVVLVRAGVGMATRYDVKDAST